MRGKYFVSVTNICVCTVMLLVSAVASSASVIYVKPGGNDSADGSSWANAKKTLTSALQTARPAHEDSEYHVTLSGDMIWVAAGTYGERITTKPGVELYGGFSGTETALEQRNFTVNVTIIDGQGTGSVITVPAGAGTDTVIYGFKITGGNAASGGGILANSASPRIVNNVITLNHAESGGGISCNGGSPVIAGNIITKNTATSGAGITCDNSSAVISNNSIVDNTATGLGGGIAGSSATVSILNNIVAFNSSGIAMQNGSPTLRNNCLYGNVGSSYSGVTAGTGDITQNPLFINRTGGDYHLAISSPCIEAGDNSGIEPQSMDMNFAPRLRGEKVDMGAYEYLTAQ